MMEKCQSAAYIVERMMGRDGNSPKVTQGKI